MIKGAIRSRSAARWGLAIVFLAFIASPVLACPMCKDSTVVGGVASQADSAGLDFNKSIYIMLGGFAGVLGMTGRVMYKAVKSSRL